MIFLAALSLSLLACGGASGGDGDGDGDGDGSSCETAANCDGIQVCEASSDTCQTDVECTDHSACGKGGNCNMATGLCEVSTTGSPCSDDAQCRLGEACVAADNMTGGFCGCDGEEFEPMPVTPNMLIVLDRSGSMNQDNKWTIATAAVEQLVTEFDGKIRFGLSQYSSDGNCGAGAIDVGIGDNTGSMVINGLSDQGSGNTPIGATLDAHLGYQGLQDPTRPNYILLISDGAETCGGDGSAAATSHFNQGTRTFAVGFGNGVGTDGAAELNAIAQNGGTARMMGGDDYYQADNAQELEDAFNTIGGTVLACSFQLSADPDAIVRVFFDGSEIPDGWTFDPDNGTITFDDQMVCDQLQGGSVDELVIVNSCPLGTD